jgi:long-subunit fatty acid transport protein
MYQQTKESIAFDQNRLYGGALYQFTGNFAVEAGYMKFFQQTNKITNDWDVVRVTVRHGIRL